MRIRQCTQLGSIELIGPHALPDVFGYCLFKHGEEVSEGDEVKEGEEVDASKPPLLPFPPFFLLEGIDQFH
jgi:hypothetical protein